MDWKEMTDVIEQVTDLLYQEKVEYAYKMLLIVLPEFENMIYVTGDEKFKGIMKEKLEIVLRAMEEMDYILVADTLNYEVVECIREFLGE